MSHFFRLSMSQAVCGIYLYYRFIHCYLKFTLNWVLCILSGHPDSLSQQPGLLKGGYLRWRYCLGLDWGIQFCQMRLLRRIGFQVPLLKLPQMDRHNTLLVCLAAESAFHECAPLEWVNWLLLSLAPGHVHQWRSPARSWELRIWTWKDIFPPWNQVTQTKQLCIKFGRNAIDCTF